MAGMKEAFAIIHALAANRVLTGNYCSFCGAEAPDMPRHNGDMHDEGCLWRIAAAWSTPREAIRAELRAKGWTLLPDGHWSACETGPLDKHGPVYQDIMIDIDPESTLRITRLCKPSDDSKSTDPRAL